MQSCKDCRHWTPDLFFTYLGRCPEKGMVTEGHMPACEAFGRKRNEGDFLWCRDCRTTVHAGDKERHDGHDLFAGCYVDPDAHELTSAGD